MIKTYDIGNYKLGASLVVRNIHEKKDFVRRYIRLVIRIFGTRTIFEFRFSNSI